VDIRDPGAPFIAGSIDTPGNAVGVTIAGSYAFVADSHEGLQIVDISNPLTPALVSNVGLESAGDVALAGQLAYVAGAQNRVEVIDVSDPSAPSYVGCIRTQTCNLRSITVSGDSLFVTDAWSGLAILPAFSTIPP
jgi:hypothetical protein